VDNGDSRFIFRFFLPWPYSSLRRGVYVRTCVCVCVELLCPWYKGSSHKKKEGRMRSFQSSTASKNETVDEVLCRLSLRTMMVLTLSFLTEFLVLR
jgi:hypothetical protein